LRALIAFLVAGCAGAPLTVKTPVHPVAVHGVRCLDRTGSPGLLCAVVMAEGADVVLDPKTAVAMTAIHGSTVTHTAWFSPPAPAPSRTFTVVGQGGSQVVTSTETVLLYQQADEHGGLPRMGRPRRGTVAYVVGDAQASYAVAGAHTNVRYLPATRLDAARTEFREHFTGGYRVLVAVKATIEDDTCVSFSYFANGELRGTVPCEETGAPEGILFENGDAAWVFRGP
jgi:hypothetical protein